MKLKNSKAQKLKIYFWDSELLSFCVLNHRASDNSAVVSVAQCNLYLYEMFWHDRVYQLWPFQETEAASIEIVFITDIEDFFQKKVFLELFVKVIPDWRSKKNYLKRFGYE